MAILQKERRRVLNGVGVANGNNSIWTKTRYAMQDQLAVRCVAGL